MIKRIDDLKDWYVAHRFILFSKRGSFGGLGVSNKLDNYVRRRTPLTPNSSTFKIPLVELITGIAAYSIHKRQH